MQGQRITCNQQEDCERHFVLQEKSLVNSFLLKLNVFTSLKSAIDNSKNNVSYIHKQQSEDVALFLYGFKALFPNRIQASSPSNSLIQNETSQLLTGSLLWILVILNNQVLY